MQVLASSLESYQKIEQERKPPSSRRSRFNSSPRGQRFSSNSVSFSEAVIFHMFVSHSMHVIGAQPLHRSSSAALSASPEPNQYAAAASSSATSALAASAAGRANYDTSSFSTPTDEYPASVQELTMNGFELSKVLHAYDLIGDNFDDLLSFLLSTATS